MTLAQHAQNRKAGDFVFGGWVTPNYTMIPDQFFDEVMAHLSEAELRVLLYIFRRTFGFKKATDDISLRQMVEGITTHDGQVLDRGCGLSKSAVAKGLNLLVGKRIIKATRNRSPEKGNLPTTYALRYAGDTDDDETGDTSDPPPMSTRKTRGSPPGRQALVHVVDTQERVRQKTVKQGDIEISKAPPVVDKVVDNHADPQPPQAISQSPPIVTLIADFSREMGDTKHLGANITQAHRIFAESGLDLDAFFDALYEARLRTRKTNGVGNRMAYFFAVLRDVAMSDRDP